MRLSESKIKTGILHDDQFVRDVAMSYFSIGLSNDRTIMPAAIQAVQRYGFQEAFTEIETLQPLVQTDQTIDWLVAEFDRLGDAADQKQWDYLSDLSWILAEADASLLKRRRGDVLEIRLLDAEAKKTIGERTRLLTVHPDECWDELENICQHVQDGSLASGQSLGRAFHLAEAIARHGDTHVDRIRSILSRQINPTIEAGSAWMQLLMTRAAGEMRFSEAIPWIVEKLQQNYEDWVHEECVLALTRIGGDMVAKAVWNACALAEHDFISLAAWVLESIHTDLAAEAVLHLFEQEEEESAKYELGQALLSHFAIDGLAPVRHLILNGAQDEEMIELRNKLLAVCTLMEAEIPEYAAWRAELQQEQAYRAKWQSPEIVVVDDWSTQLSSKPRRPANELPPLRISNVPPPARVGRNAPCPCNSGKKYKHCCLRQI